MIQSSFGKIQRNSSPYCLGGNCGGTTINRNGVPTQASVHTQKLGTQAKGTQQKLGSQQKMGGSSGTGLQAAGLVLQGISLIMNTILGFKQLAIQEKTGEASTLFSNNNVKLANAKYVDLKNNRSRQAAYTLAKNKSTAMEAKLSDYYNQSGVLLDAHGNKVNGLNLKGFDWKADKETDIKGIDNNADERTAYIKKIQGDTGEKTSAFAKTESSPQTGAVEPLASRNKTLSAFASSAKQEGNGANSELTSTGEIIKKTGPIIAKRKATINPEKSDEEDKIIKKKETELGIA